MITKKPHFSFQKDDKFGDGSKSIFDKDRYSNLKLKRQHSSLSDDLIRSASSKDSRQSSPVIDYTYECESRKNEFQKRVSRLTPSELMKTEKWYEENEKKFTGKTSTNEGSTLSLHISAYENSSSDTVNACKRNDSKESESNVKHDPFQFQRQQQNMNDNIGSETMKFRASDQMLNRHPLIRSPQSNLDSDEDDYSEIAEKSVKSVVVVIPNAKIHPSEMKKKLTEYKQQILTEKSMIKENLANLDKEILRAFRAEKRIMEEIGERIRDRRSLPNRYILQLQTCQKRTIKALKDRTSAFDNYHKLEDQEYSIRQQIRQLDEKEMK